MTGVPKLFLSVAFDPDVHDVASFGSGRPMLDEWLVRHAAAAQQRRVARAFVWLDEESRVVACYSLAGHLVDRADLGRLGRGGPGRVPAILLARPALDRALHGAGHHGRLLWDALSRPGRLTRPGVRNNRQVAFSRPPAPEPLPLPVVDNHVHLDHTRSGDEPFGLDEALAAAAAVNVTRHVQIGCELDSARSTVEVVERYPQILGGVALHPTEASRIVAAQPDRATAERALDEAFDEIARLATHPRVRVVGETGLDHYWVDEDDTVGRAAQRVSFARHIDLAKRLGKVLQIHDRDAHDAVLDVLAAEGAPDRTVFHCFSGDVEMAKVCADNGWYLSFAGTLTFRNATALREALAAVPLEQVLVETDAPYLAPVPHRGRTNAGYLVPLTVRCMAEVLGADLEALCARLDATSEALYGPW